MNRDEGAYQLSPLWTQVISTPKPGGEGASTKWNKFDGIVFLPVDEIYVIISTVSF